MSSNDSDRPPVLAHQRFVDDRKSFADLNLAPSLIESLQARAAAGEIRGQYDLADITRDCLPRRGAILGRDALGHLSFADIERTVANFKASGAVWLIATTFADWQTNGDCEGGDWRALNFERAPFNWGPPVALLNENCTEAGGGWRDKSPGVCRLAGLGESSCRGSAL